MYFSNFFLKSCTFYIFYKSIKFRFARYQQNLQTLGKYVLRELAKYEAYNRKNVKNKNNTNNDNIISGKRFLKSFSDWFGYIFDKIITMKRYYGNEVKAADDLMGLLQVVSPLEYFSFAGKHGLTSGNFSESTETLLKLNVCKKIIEIN